MIKLSFITGGALRKVNIEGRKIFMMSQETGFTPQLMDLDKLNNKELKKKMGVEQMRLMKEIAGLDTEEEMAQDIIKDFQRTGWRLVKKECQ